MRRLLFALPFVAAAACTYDWTVGPPGGASSGGTADSGGNDAAGDTATSGDCQGFKTQIDLARARILSCSGGPCSQSTADECGCTIPVSDAQSSAAKSYAAAVAAFKNAGCVGDCSSGCTAVLHACINGSICG